MGPTCFPILLITTQWSVWEVWRRWRRNEEGFGQEGEKVVTTSVKSRAVRGTGGMITQCSWGLKGKKA